MGRLPVVGHVEGPLERAHDAGVVAGERPHVEDGAVVVEQGGGGEVSVELVQADGDIDRFGELVDGACAL